MVLPVCWLEQECHTMAETVANLLLEKRPNTASLFPGTVHFCWTALAVPNASYS